MADLLLAWNDALAAGDLEVSGADLAGAAGGLQTAILMSLFTDRRVAEEELPPGETDRRGWWGDSLAERPGDQTGSRLWLLAREKLTDDVLARAEEYTRECLAWTTEDGVASSVTVEVKRRDLDEILFRIRVHMQDSDREFQFSSRLQDL